MTVQKVVTTRELPCLCAEHIRLSEKQTLTTCAECTERWEKEGEDSFKTIDKPKKTRLPVELTHEELDRLNELSVAYDESKEAVIKRAVRLLDRQTLHECCQCAEAEGSVLSSVGYWCPACVEAAKRGDA